MNPNFTGSGINIYLFSNNTYVQWNRSEILSGIFIYIKFLNSVFSKIRNSLFLLKLNKYLKYLFIFYFSIFSSFFFIFHFREGSS